LDREADPSHGSDRMSTPPDTTQLLLDARSGDREAFDRLFSHVYDELRQIAHRRLLNYRPGQTLDTTALVHEAYLRLVDQARSGDRDRAHFFALASRAMRFVLVDYARARSAQKRGGGAADVPLDAVQVAAEERAADLLTLSDALEQLSGVSTRLSEIVEYRFFGGLTFDEIAEAMGLSTPTIKRDWVRARAWLYRSMQTAAG
jgi:RNA polymerase sigma factor (TIGR02999 family)